MNIDKVKEYLTLAIKEIGETTPNPLPTNPSPFDHKSTDTGGDLRPGESKPVPDQPKPWWLGPDGKTRIAWTAADLASLPMVIRRMIAGNYTEDALVLFAQYQPNKIFWWDGDGKVTDVRPAWAPVP